MRIAIDARLVFYRRGGIATYILGLLQGLSEIPTSDEFIVLQSRGHDDDLFPRGFNRRGLWTPCHHRFERLALAFELIGTRLDVLHSPDFIPPSRLLGGRRSVITVHDLGFLKFPGVLTPESQRYYSQIGPAVEEADAVIAVSENTKRDLMALLDAPERKIVVIPEAANPVYRPMDDPASTDRVLQRHRISDGFFLFVGTVEPRKNLRTLISSYFHFRQVGASNGTLPQLVIAGPRGWLYEGVFGLVQQLHLEEYVRFLGPVSSEDLVLLYNAALALTYPSLYEGFGLPALEAMACGTPVITSNSSSLPEVVGDAAISVDPNDGEALTESMIRVWSSAELRADLRRRGFAQATLFSWEKTAKATLEVYHQSRSGKC